MKDPPFGAEINHNNRKNLSYIDPPNISEPIQTSLWLLRNQDGKEIPNRGLSVAFSSFIRGARWGISCKSSQKRRQGRHEANQMSVGSDVLPLQRPSKVDLT
ncbi:hypothetical protein Bca4012_060947 [Brassica carinata]